MGYRVLGTTDTLLRGYGPRAGLEGPFIFGNNRILYYDPREGQYYDPTTDFYVEHEEMDQIHAELTRMLSR
jgi:hypothetical protein